jgi:PadR family transcriptional regulator PadR
MVSKALVAASAKPVILALLLNGENYGYQILQRIRHVHRLENDGFIKSRWQLSERGRMRKYYFLTESGREELETEKEHWLSVHAALTKLWAPAKALD